jgi:hypothetical protein
MYTNKKILYVVLYSSQENIQSRLLEASENNTLSDIQWSIVAHETHLDPPLLASEITLPSDQPPATWRRFEPPPRTSAPPFSLPPGLSSSSSSADHTRLVVALLVVAFALLAVVVVVAVRVNRQRQSSNTDQQP